MHLADRAERQPRSAAALEQLRLTRDSFPAWGLRRVSSPAAAPAVLTSIPRNTFSPNCRPGPYIFMDRQYNDVWTGPVGPPFETSLFVLTRVVSANHSGMVTTDAGLKVLFH